MAETERRAEADGPIRFASALGNLGEAMNADGLTLLIPAKADVERDAVAAAWARRGGTVVRLDRFWEPPPLDAERVRLYGNDTFCLVLQQKLNLDLISPADDLILQVPASGTRRALTRQTIGAAPTLAYPVFAKPMTPKLFRARVYASPEELDAECAGLPAETAILLSEIVAFTAEARCFVLEGRVLDCAVYEGEGDLDAAVAFARALVAAVSGPRAYVLDVGLISDRGWAVVEFNAAWGAGLNGCDPERVLSAIAAASGPALAQQAHTPDSATERLFTHRG